MEEKNCKVLQYGTITNTIQEEQIEVQSVHTPTVISLSVTYNQRRCLHTTNPTFLSCSKYCSLLNLVGLFIARERQDTPHFFRAANEKVQKTANSCHFTDFVTRVNALIGHLLCTNQYAGFLSRPNQLAFFMSYELDNQYDARDHC